ncbi:MAG TPA: XRE family transcriptional regulator [Gammaproteobacteria bacterium]|nr:XRE family transcriptional regulator [Gammaproteobacteria bacterium]
MARLHNRETGLLYFPESLVGVPQSTISAIENNSVQLGVESAKVLARTLKCHPVVLVFSGWNILHKSAA